MLIKVQETCSWVNLLTWIMGLSTLVHDSNYDLSNFILFYFFKEISSSQDKLTQIHSSFPLGGAKFILLKEHLFYLQLNG